MAKLKVALAALSLTYNGRKQEIQPNEVFDASKANLDGISDSYFRDPDEKEVALWQMQNASRERTVAAGQQRAPVSQVKEPTDPNGPGGATEQDETPNGEGSVATDADTVGATDQAKEGSTGTTGAAGGTETGKKTSSEGGAKKAPAKKRKDDDLA